jgi:hypothetical protein
VNAFLAGADEATVALSILLSPEYQNAHSDNASYVTGLYHDVVGRAPDSQGEQAFEQMLQNGTSRAIVGLFFLHSGEVDAALVKLYYAAYFNRAPDGLAAFWVSQLDSGHLSQAAVGEILLASDEFFGNPH